MSSDRRLTLTGWASVLSGALHLVAGSAHHGGSSATGHTAAMVATGALQLVVGGAVLQRSGAADGRRARRLVALAAGVAAATLGAAAWEVTTGAHEPDPLVVGMASLAIVIVGLELSRHRQAVPGWMAAAVAVVLLATGLGPAAVRAGAADDNTPGGCNAPNRFVHLYAEQLPTVDGRVRLGWGLRPGTATIPGPLIEMIEGDCLAVTVHNDIPESTLLALREDEKTPVGVSLHVHGVKYRAASDGTAHNDSWVPPGSSRTYIWYAQPRVVAAGKVTSNGTAGTWWYHDHVVGTHHGTGGGEAGLVGGLVVRRATDPKPDRTYTVVMGPGERLNYAGPDGFCANPSTAPSSNHCLEATEGERVEFVVFNVGDAMHTFHLHGHNWADNRTGIPDVATDTQLIDARIIGPSESFGFQVIAGESVGPGDWMLHCHVQSHSDAGMTTDFHVAPRGSAPVPADATDALPVHSH